jgi:hypothetical protein
MDTETEYAPERLDDVEYRPEESCPACGRRPRFLGHRKSGRLEAYQCSECNLLFEVMNPNAPTKQRTQRPRRGNDGQGRLFDS